MKTVKTKSPKPRFEFITVSAPGEEVGGVLVDNLHHTPAILMPFGWLRTSDLKTALSRAALSVSGATGSTVCKAAVTYEIAVTGTLAVEWQEILKNRESEFWAACRVQDCDLCAEARA